MPRADRVPFLPGRRLVAVHATVNELDVVLIADTGAEPTIISRRVAGASSWILTGRYGYSRCTALVRAHRCQWFD